ncbi:C-terminal, D2-small domain-containing protein, of ClpB protein, partial [Pseudomonas delhiensis]
MAQFTRLRLNPNRAQPLIEFCLLLGSGARNIDNLLNQQILPVLSQQLLQRQTTAVTHGYSADDGIA